MVDYNKLMTVLEKELSCQNRLLKTLADERRALISFDREKVEEIAKDKEKIIQEAQQLQIKRLEVLGINNDLPDKETMRLGNVVESCTSPKIKQTLGKMRLELKATADAVKTLNDHNSGLIKQSLGLIASTLSIMRSAPEAELPTYGINAKLSNNLQDPAFGPKAKTLVRSA
ncbi:MAG: flagellar protein FlgN [Deltaproteobacteria bacterium]|nr:flagellar protein FlgN [Deltaproteobacteria bacterium]